MPQAKSPVVEGLEKHEIVLAKNQPEYIPLPALAGGASMFRTILTRWGFDQQERDLIAEGKDLYLAVLTFGRPFQPVKLTVGTPDPGIEYDNSVDAFDEACGNVVRAWKEAMLAVSTLDVEADRKRADFTRHMLGALHSLVGTTLPKEPGNVILEA